MKGQLPPYPQMQDRGSGLGLRSALSMLPLCHKGQTLDLADNDPSAM